MHTNWVQKFLTYLLGGYLHYFLLKVEVLRTLLTMTSKLRYMLWYSCCFSKTIHIWITQSYVSLVAVYNGIYPSWTVT